MRFLKYFLLLLIVFVFGIFILDSNFSLGFLKLDFQKKAINVKPVINESVGKYYTSAAIKTDLENIWGKGVTKNGKQKNPYCGSLPQMDGYKILITEKYNDTNVTIYSPDSVSLDTPEVVGGRILIKEWFNYIKKKNYVFPCENLYITTHLNFAAASPGQVFVGGWSGLNAFGLIWHELFHSIFNGQYIDSLWMKEQAAYIVVDFLLDESKRSIPWSLDYFPSIPRANVSSLESRYFEYMEEGWINYQRGEVYRSNNLCDLKYPETDDEYVVYNFWGEVFFLDLAYDYGVKTMEDALRALYEKFQYSVSSKVTVKDFYDAFLYYIEKNHPTDAEIFERAKSLLSTKLCIDQ